MSLLGTSSLLGSGVLGGLYWLERQAKRSSDSALQDVSACLSGLI